MGGHCVMIAHHPNMKGWYDMRTLTIRDGVYENDDAVMIEVNHMGNFQPIGGLGKANHNRYGGYNDYDYGIYEQIPYDERRFTLTHE